MDSLLLCGNLNFSLHHYSICVWSTIQTSKCQSSGLVLVACSTKVIGSADFSSHMWSYPSLDILLGFDSQFKGLQLILKCCWSKKCKETYLTKLPW